MIAAMILLVVGGGLLVKSADHMVEGAARLARRRGLSDLLVGLTLTSIGTSVPELASSIAATLQGNPGLALGNVMGSNIANVGLILGVSAVISPLSTERKMHERDGFVMFAATLLVFLLALDNELGRFDALVLVLLYGCYLGFLVRTDQGERDHRFRSFVDFVVDAAAPSSLVGGARRLVEPRAEKPLEGPSDAGAGSASRDLMVLATAGVGVAVGAHLFTSRALILATAIGIPDALVGLSLVAVGTSLPELSVAVAAARQGRAEMVVGNVMGSNIANLLLILGLCGLGSPIPVSELSVVFVLPFVLFFGLGLLYLVRSDWQVTRTQGIATVTAYVGFLGLALLLGGS